MYKYSKREKGMVCMYVHWEWKMLNEHRILEPSSNKLINQTSFKYVRSVIYLVPLINIRYQQGHWPHNLFAHGLNCALVYTRL